MKPYVCAALAAIMLAGCATGHGPRYERAERPGDFGYYDVRLDDNRYRVHYRSERGVSAEDFAMRRAAELTLQHRYDWFQVIGRSRAMSDRVFDRYEGTRYYGDERAYRDRPRYSQWDGYDDSMATLEIVMGYNPPPRASSIYDARRVLDYRAGARYDRY
jgi:hypothetical protein